MRCCFTGGRLLGRITETENISWIPLGFFSWTPFGVVILAASIGFMLMFGRNMLSKGLTAEEAGSSPLIGRSVAQAQLVDRLGLVGVSFEKHQHGREQFLPAMPEQAGPM